MKMNLDCIRDILLYVEENLIIEISNGTQEQSKELTLLTLCNDLKTKYTEGDIWYNAWILSDAKFLEITNINSNILRNNRIVSITYTGHQFLETIRPKTVWEQTKMIVTKAGSSALQFVASTAQMILAECAKQAVASFVSGGSAPM
nr:MAG TPA: Flagellin, PadR, transcription factor, DNA.8A [Caudoviricetes sp.]